MATTPAPMTTLQLVNYYANLLILQYLQQPKAYATVQAQATPVLMPQVSVQQLTFSGIPASGQFSLSYGGLTSALISWNTSLSAIQAIIRTLPGLGSATVTGSLASQSLVVTFTGVNGVANSLVVVTDTLLTAATVKIKITITETDVTLPIAVQNAFNLIGSSPAVGVQLDVLGKYAGVVRSGQGFNGPITLNDSDFVAFIQLAIVTNSAGSSLATIQQLLHDFFPNKILVFDYLGMRMSYFINSSLGSLNLAELFVTEGLLPKPMGVQLGVTIYSADVNKFFGMRTYDLPPANVSPLNTYDSYNMDSPWLVYGDGLII